MKLHVKCEICNQLCPSLHFLGFHLKKHKILSKDYYDMYFKKDGEGICEVCGKLTNFKTLEIGYRKHCGNSCGTLDKKIQEKKKNTCLAKYSNSNFTNREQAKNTIKNLYGENPYFLYSNKEWNNYCTKLAILTRAEYTDEEKLKIKEKQKKTNLEKYGYEFVMQVPEIREKIEKTMIKKYGGKTTMESPILKEQVFKTKQERYNNSYYNNPEKQKETLIKTKGIICGCQSVDENGIKKKIITNNKKYGYDYPHQNYNWLNEHQFSKYNYENICFDSSWELAFYLWLKEHEIRFEYHPRPINYYWSENNSYHMYYPDFKLWNSTLIEFKRPDLYEK